ncbi:MAG: 2-phosphosulfolactate phosphatase [Pirellulales bacterium]|nr:2-phosphosulfolactate phosphatase [Pirellulales bacterium]
MSMANVLNVHAKPSLVDPQELVGATVVVVDVLRASTTIVYALEAGAECVVPCVEVDEAREIAQRHSGGQVLLGGERNGLPIDGFDLGNSPAEYSAERVGGKTIVFTTTNGTGALQRALPADRILIGAFVNASAIVEQLLNQKRIHVLCASTRGQFSTDDILLAGMLVERVQRQGSLLYEQNAQAITARENWLHSFALPCALGAEPLQPQRLAKELRKSAGGKNLVAIGMEDDILAASQIDRFSGVPELDGKRLRIELA